MLAHDVRSAVKRQRKWAVQVLGKMSDHDTIRQDRDAGGRDLPE